MAIGHNVIIQDTLLSNKYYYTEEHGKEDLLRWNRTPRSSEASMRTVLKMDALGFVGVTCKWHGRMDVSVPSAHLLSCCLVP